MNHTNPLDHTGQAVAIQSCCFLGVAVSESSFPLQVSSLCSSNSSTGGTVTLPCRAHVDHLNTFVLTNMQM